MADLWLAGMAEGAAASKRTVQYCMPYPNQILSAAAYPAVTNARATGDYFHGDNQGHDSLEHLLYKMIKLVIEELQMGIFEE